MTAIQELVGIPSETNAWQQIWRAWSSLDRRSWACSVVVGLVVSGIGLPTLMDWKGESRSAGLFSYFLLAPQLGAAWLMLCYVAADAVDGVRLGRTGRLVLAVVLATLLDLFVTPALLIHALSLTDPVQLEIQLHGSVVSPSWALKTAGDLISSFVYGGLLVVLAEAWRAKQKANQQYVQAEESRSILMRRVLQSRLAAMQAQVEPQFLFETLVEIERLYESDSVAASSLLDRLIVFLRVALPGLRESGSSLAAEADLVAAYVSVMHARSSNAALVAIDLPLEARGFAVSPMLLLPLVQRSLRRGAVVSRAEAVRISAEQVGEGWRVKVTIAVADSGEEDEELRRVKERLRGLYGPAAALTWTSQTGKSEYVLSIPHAAKIA
jgi:hypothetical protein